MSYPRHHPPYAVDERVSAISLVYLLLMFPLMSTLGPRHQTSLSTSNNTRRTRATALVALLAVSVAGLATAACGGGDTTESLPGPSAGYGYGPSASGLPPSGVATSTTPASTSAAKDGGSSVSPSITGSDASVPTVPSAPVDAAPPPPADAGLVIESFTLLDTSNITFVDGSPIPGHNPLTDGSVLSLAVVGTNLSIRANVGSVGSVEFVYGAITHTENAAPYTLCGDNGQGTITDCTLVAGAYTLTATPYSAPDRVGIVGTPVTIHFTITP